MSITFNEQGQEIETKLSQPQVLSLGENNEILMTLTWEDGEQKVLPLNDFLDLTDIEKAEIEKLYKPMGYTLVAQRVIGQDYPDYFKDFHDAKKQLFVDGKELFLQRDQFKEDTSNVIFPDREKRELIFMKLNLPTTITEVVKEKTFSFRKIIDDILANLGQTK